MTRQLFDRVNQPRHHQEVHVERQFLDECEARNLEGRVPLTALVATEIGHGEIRATTTR